MSTQTEAPLAVEVEIMGHQRAVDAAVAARRAGKARLYRGDGQPIYSTGSSSTGSAWPRWARRSGPSGRRQTASPARSSVDRPPGGGRPARPPHRGRAAVRRHQAAVHQGGRRPPAPGDPAGPLPAGRRAGGPRRLPPARPLRGAARRGRGQGGHREGGPLRPGSGAAGSPGAGRGPGRHARAGVRRRRPPAARGRLGAGWPKRRSCARGARAPTTGPPTARPSYSRSCAPAAATAPRRDRRHRPWPHHSRAWPPRDGTSCARWRRS